MSLKAIIYDLDGVITDTAKYHYESWKWVAEQLDFVLTEKQNQKLKGVGRKECLDKLLKYLIEIKPKKQTLEPKKPKRKTPRYITEVTTYVTNQAKWEAAREWCADRRMEFLILTEEHLNV